MNCAFIVARNSSRAALWRFFPTARIGHRFLIIQKEYPLNSNRPARFSTSQNTNAVAEEHDHSHSKIWTAERVLSAALIGILPAAVAFPSPVLDYALALSLTIHVHWGIEAIAVDYARPSVVGPVLSKAAVGAVYALSVFTLGGLFYFNYTDVGLGQAIRMLWKL